MNVRMCGVKTGSSFPSGSGDAAKDAWQWSRE
jgi:hypothetical protein